MTRSSHSDDSAFVHRSRHDGYGFHAIEDVCFDAHKPTPEDWEDFWSSDDLPLRIGRRVRTSGGAIREWTGEGWVKVGTWDLALDLPTTESHIERGQE